MLTYADGHAMVYVLLTTGMLHLPASYSIGDPHKLSRKSAYWAHRYVENIANLRWSDMIQDIRSARHRLFQHSLVVMEELDKSLAMSPPQVRESESI